MQDLKRRLLLCGFGNVGRAFTRLIAEKKVFIREKYGIDIQLTAVVDIGGAAVAEASALPEIQLLDHFKAGKAIETIQPFGIPGATAVDLMGKINADVLVETTPTNLKDGEPAKSHIVAAIESRMDVVSANKGPLVLFYDDMVSKARRHGVQLKMSAATAAALPTLDVGQLCLAGSSILSIEGILNGTTNYILTRMHLENCSYETALKDAQQLGIAETDPKMDVDGLDTRNKIILITNQLFDRRFTLSEVPVTGITHILPADIVKAKSNGQVIKLIGSAVKENGAIKLEVAPRSLAMDHPLASINYAEKGIRYFTDSMGSITVSGGKSSPVGAAAALLKDLVHLSLRTIC